MKSRERWGDVFFVFEDDNVMSVVDGGILL
jgi:hypothetical protein